MKNEVKLNIHLFFPEQQNEEISDTRNEAFKALLELSELNDKNSIKKFTNELKTRFELIKPILGNETEDFLGYNQEDVEKITKFFNGNYEKFGMDAVAVQKILRSIWLKTPCEDKRLNYDLYDFIDKKFYNIVYKWKKNISFDDISAPVDSSWEELVRHWTECRERYAKALEIDLEYLDTEAINGLEFPSASGLFANPAVLDYTECFCLEFLNFWMPHLQENVGMHKRAQQYFSQRYNVTAKNIWENFNFSLPYYHNGSQLKISLEGLKSSWFQKYIEFFNEKLHFDSFLEMRQINVSPKDRDDINDDNYLDIAKNERASFYENIKTIFSRQQPTDFFTLGKMLGYPVYRNCNYITDNIFNPGKQQLPKFINSCNEFVMQNNKVVYGKSLRFYNNQKIYLPRNKNYRELLRYAKAYDAAIVPMPVFDKDNHIESVAQITKYYDNEFNIMYDLQFKNDKNSDATQSVELGNYESWLKSRIENKPQILNIFYYRTKEFTELLIKVVDFYANNDLSIPLKLKVLATINKHFSNSKFLQGALTPYIDNCIEELSKKGDGSMAEATSFSLADEINFFYKLQEFEKRKLEAEKAETQRELFSRLNHSIKNLVGSVSKTLKWAKNQYELSPPVRRLINRANQGANLISDIANAISLAYRNDENSWEKDLNTGKDCGNMEQIVLNALFHAVPNILSGNSISSYRNEFNLYFPTQEEQEDAEISWYGATTTDLKIQWIDKNLFNLDLTIDETVKNLQIGDEHATFTHFFILFNEIFLNTIKAVVYVDKQFRKCKINITISNGSLEFYLENSACRDRTQKKDGFGHIIIENYCEKFKFQDFKERYDDDMKMYTLYFKFNLPIISEERQK